MATVIASVTNTTSTTTNTSLPSPASSPPPSEPQPSFTPQDSQPHSLQSSSSWKSFRSTITFSEKTTSQLGWAIACLSVVITIVALSPAFKSQTAAEKALQIAEWTALKDYIEDCREELAAGIESQACLKAMKATLPPPPYVQPGILDKMRRRFLNPPGRHSGNWTSRGAVPEYSEFQLPRAVQALVFLIVLLSACVFFFLSFESNRSRIHNSYTHHFFDKEQGKYTPPSTQSPESNQTTGSLRHSLSLSDTTLRRRTIRTHPIYRQDNLDEAFHHEDISEIRTRLQNGEDVNQHWLYLIYRLAISPPSLESAKRLEIAQLCLDYGADVNALKGWNGQSALMIAIHFGNVDVAKLLISNGASVCYAPPDSGLTALHRCVRLAVTGCSADALEIMKMLFVYGANPNQADRLSETPLHKLLIDAWFSRHDEQSMKKLYPIALCLVEHNAMMPETIKEKYILGNPLWGVVHKAIWETEWPEHVGPDNQTVRSGRFWVKNKEAEKAEGKQKWVFTRDVRDWMDEKANFDFFWM
ncbi:hypothetical protein K469DRAFT_570897 [Zopfia rhizophila CBS 207.26]|uniref:Uncharacterized protein n=1 Tax=Zopfia rhizophila CBS 207.26 TaxID=1314779 RepID=A0A6A6E9G8_9PEZI|nr:hypothetical protein K469DRAFT_570897 [Zopfia rhizophila CBS 207.26]